MVLQALWRQPDAPPARCLAHLLSRSLALLKLPVGAERWPTVQQHCRAWQSSSAACSSAALQLVSEHCLSSASVFQLLQLLPWPLRLPHASLLRLHGPQLLRPLDLMSKRLLLLLLLVLVGTDALQVHPPLHQMSQLSNRLWCGIRGALQLPLRQRQEQGWN
jgi:hypothetical protein